MVNFKIGDVVYLKKQSRYNSAWGGPMVVERIFPVSGSIHARHPIHPLGGFNISELEPAEGPW